MPTVHVFVEGRVQGVFYRHSTVEAARALGLCGWVRNLPDGRVELEASGNKAKLEELVRWCRTGPPHASVTNVDAKWHDADSHDGGFHVR